MQAPPKFLICLGALALAISACSSTTVVADNERQSVADTAVDPLDAVTSQLDEANEPAADTDTTVDASEDDAGTDGALSPSQLEEEDGFGLGGSEQLTGLAGDCEAGNDMACDILFQISAFDSPQEDIAVTCAGRSETTVFFCTEGIDQVAGEFFFDSASPALPGIVSACEQGDFTACDFLYFRSPLGSEFEEIGNSCAGRVQVAVPDCRTVFEESTP